MAGLCAVIVIGAVVAAVLAPDLPAAPARALVPPGAPAVAGPRTDSSALRRLPPIPRIATASVARSLPERIACHDVDRGECERVVRAALRVLPADLPDVAAAAVWRSLVCNDTFDCPPAYLRDSDPIGSVIVRFADDSPAVSVNVVDWRYGSAIRLGLRAWIARSAPAID